MINIANGSGNGMGSECGIDRDVNTPINYATS